MASRMKDILAQNTILIAQGKWASGNVKHCNVSVLVSLPFYHYLHVLLYSTVQIASQRMFLGPMCGVCEKGCSHNHGITDYSHQLHV